MAGVSRPWGQSRGRISPSAAGLRPSEKPPRGRAWGLPLGYVQTFTNGPLNLLGTRWWLMWGHPRPCHHGRHAALLRARQRFVTSSLISDVAGDIMGLLNLPVAGGNEILPVMLGAEPVLAVAVPSCPLCVAPPAFLGLLWVFSGGPGTSPGC